MSKSIQDKKSVYNLSSTILSSLQISVLEKGLKFGVKSKRVDEIEILTRFEAVAQQLNRVNKSPVDSSISNNNMKSIVSNGNSFFHQFQGFAFEYLKLCKKKENNISDEQYSALQDLAHNESIVVTKADKGNAVVVLDKDKYNTKILEILSDKKKFECIESDLTIQRENSLLNKLKHLKSQNIISLEIYEKIRPIGSRPGIIYGLPKIHKENYPLRPIISAAGTYNYDLAKYLDELIKPLLANSKYILKDTFDFVNRVSKLKETSGFMVSFDVESLFTNIPLEETINLVVNQAFDNGKNSTFHKFSQKEFRNLLYRATKESHFHFLGNHFDQIDGVTMGSPLAPTLANFFMNWFEVKCMCELEKQGLVIWYRFVDDTFAVIRDASKVEDILKLLNGQHKNIKFTYEKEKNKKIAFLDALVSRKNDGFTTTLYRKPTFTGVYLNWKSLTTKSYKINVIKCMLDRAWKICSNYELFHLEILSVKEILMKNDYPRSVIDKEISIFIGKKFKNSEVEKDKDKDKDKSKIFLVLPYFNSQMDEFASRLSNFVSRYYPTVKFRVMFTCPTTLGKMFSFKEKTPNDLRSLLVYKINCSNCNDFYIGKTSRCLIRRIHEHKSGTGTGDYKSSLYKHSQDTGHVIDYNNVEILDTASSDHKLLLKEMLYINKLKPTLNKQTKSSLFSLIIGSKG